MLIDIFDKVPKEWEHQKEVDEDTIDKEDELNTLLNLVRQHDMDDLCQQELLIM